MKRSRVGVLAFVSAATLVGAGVLAVHAQSTKVISSYGPNNQDMTFDQIKAARLAVKAERAKAHAALLASRYDLEEAKGGALMSGGKAVPAGPTARLNGTTWEQLGKMTPEQIKQKGLFPYQPLPFPDHAEGGMLFPKMTIDLLPRLTRFDLDFDLPEHVLPEKAPPIFLTTRPDLGDVSKSKVITLENYYEIFNGLLNPKQLEGLRLLVTQFPQQQFNSTEDRRTDRADGMIGVTCFDCHVNGHTNKATHLVGDIRPQEFRHRINTPSLRGVNVQRLFGSQRALKTVEDFTEFEQRAAYFDGDHTMAAKKGVNVLERGSQVHFMSEFMALLDFPPAPKLDIYGELDASKATAAEVRGAGPLQRQGPLLHVPSRPQLHRQRHAQPQGRAVLRDDLGERHDDGARRPDQDLPASWHQGLAALSSRRALPDPRGHGGVLQPDPAAPADGSGEEGPRGLPARPVGSSACRPAFGLENETRCRAALAPRRRATRGRRSRP